VQRLGRKIEQRWLWRGVSFELEPQRRLGLVGPSGSGKTLLLRSLVQLDRVDEEDLGFEGRSLSHWGLPLYRTKVIYLPQRPVLFEGSVEDNLQMLFQLAVHRGKRYDGDRIRSYLDKLHRNPDFLSRAAPQLSGGEAQILGLLRALQLDPQVLLLDEPTASLDPESTAQVEELLADWLRAEPRRACIWTSHDGAQIERVTDGRFDLLEVQNVG
jgi:putative ABC transport system ATP-binding protein